MDALHDSRLLEDIGQDDEETTKAFWKSSQPALANAFSLVQLGMELGLKARIAEVSPYLLIANDPKDWPRRIALDDTFFSEFRLLDAADLVKVHNSLISPRLSDDFARFWDQVRRDRNKILHSVAPKIFDPATIIRTILTAAEILFDDMAWSMRLIHAHDNDRNAASGSAEYTYNVVMQEINDAISFLTPTEAKRFLGFDKRRRAFLCPKCHYASNRDWQEEWPNLAQLRTKKADETNLDCILCKTPTVVVRADCVAIGCKGNVLADDLCLTCASEQSNVFWIETDLIDDTLNRECEYVFSFAKHEGRSSAPIPLRSADDSNAKAYAKLAIKAPHLSSWESVTVRQRQGNLLSLDGKSERILGSWTRLDQKLIWSAGEAADSPTLY